MCFHEGRSVDLPLGLFYNRKDEAANGLKKREDPYGLSILDLGDPARGLGPGQGGGMASNYRMAGGKGNY